VTEAAPDLTDGVIRLRRWVATDAEAVFHACQDPDIARFVPIPQPYTRDDAAWFVDHAATESDAGRGAYRAIVDPASGELLGAVGQHGPWGHRASFGYWLAPEARGLGVATRALKLISEWTIATRPEVIRLELYTDLANDRSGRVAERAGFLREGIRYAWDLDRQGQPLDVMFYVRIRGR
jgi:RimJ/RimL family protein N-acetyltransferase